jgi:hypothetical protein
MATSPTPEKTDMFKKSLIASVLAIATFGAFAQASATPATPAVPSTAVAPAKALGATKEKREELRKKVMVERKVKHAAGKARREQVRAALAKAKAGKAVTNGAPIAPVVKQ